MQYDYNMDAHQLFAEAVALSSHEGNGGLRGVQLCVRVGQPRLRRCRFDFVPSDVVCEGHPSLTACYQPHVEEKDKSGGRDKT